MKRIVAIIFISVSVYALYSIAAADPGEGANNTNNDAAEVDIVLEDKHAITDNGIWVVLYKDGEWDWLDNDYWTELKIFPLACTKDSQRIFLEWSDLRKWYIISSLDSLLRALNSERLGEIESLPYYVVRKPQSLTSPVPKYPDKAKKQGLMGKVVVKMLIDKDGSVIDVKIIQSCCAVLNQAAIDAAQQSTFTPAMQNGKTVRVWVSRPYVFKLQ